MCLDLYRYYSVCTRDTEAPNTPSKISNLLRPPIHTACSYVDFFFEVLRHHRLDQQDTNTEFSALPQHSPLSPGWQPIISTIQAASSSSFVIFHLDIYFTYTFLYMCHVYWLLLCICVMICSFW